jgi:hypothetical protein
MANFKKRRHFGRRSCRMCRPWKLCGTRLTDGSASLSFAASEAGPVGFAAATWIGSFVRRADLRQVRLALDACSGSCLPSN